MTALLFWFMWFCGACFTFGYSRAPDKGWVEWTICVLVWPLVLGDLMGSKL